MACPNAFNALRPLCVVLMKEQTLDQVQAVSRVVEGLDPETLQSLQQYVLFPLRILLKNQAKLATGVCEAGVDCMRLVLQKTTISNWEMFSDIFTALCISISSKAACGQASQTSEELKLAVVKALGAMVKSADSDVLLHLFSARSLPMLGHCVSLLLSLAEAEKMRELQGAALQCLTNFVPDDSSAESALYQAASRVFASFLPGISVTVSRVIIADPKQGQSVTVNAIDCWSKHVAMVMDHRLLPSDKPQTEGKDAAKGKQPIEGEQTLLINKTKSWVTETAYKLDILVTKIIAMVTSRSWKVRLALVRFADLLISRTKNSMPGSLNHLLELLVNLAQDDYSQVSSKSRVILRSLAEQPLTSESRMLSELLEDNMHRLVTSLPRVIRTADEETKLSSVTAMTGYIKLLGYKLNCMLNSAPHLKRLSIALLQALELDVRDLSVLETGNTLADTSNGDLSTSDISLHSRHLRNFKHFSDSRIYDGIVRICQLLGKFGNVPLLIDNFLSYFHESSSYVKQATMIMNEIMAGTLLVVDDDDQSLTSIWKEEIEGEMTDTEELKSVVRMLLDEFLSPSCWDLPTSIQCSAPSSSSPASSPRLPWQLSDESHMTGLMIHSPRSRDELTASEMNHNTLLKCLLLDGMGIYAQVLGPAFGQLLMHCIYPILERMADERTIISQHAHATLAMICQPCGYRSIAELLFANVDYLTDAISTRLRHFEWNPKAPLVLKVTLQHSASDILPLLEDTVEEVLRIMDDHHGNHAASLMSVLQALVTAIKEWFPVEEREGGGDKVESSKSDPVKDITSFCLDYIKAMDIDDDDDDAHPNAVENDAKDDDVDDEDMMKYQEEIDKPKELPLHIKIVKKVLEHCVHLVSSADPRLRLLVLSTVQVAVETLETSQDELLPLVHKLWPAFVQRFSDQETLVTCKAFETLLILADTARDFIRRRTVTDVWPKLVKFLQLQAKISAKAGTSYHHTAYYKLQDSILSGIGHLCLQVDVGGGELLSMVQACLPYLNKCQPIGLQEACLASFECFLEADPDAVWFSLQDVYCPTPVTPPHPSLPACKFAGEEAAGREGWSNIDHLLR